LTANCSTVKLVSGYIIVRMGMCVVI
jgi:hypothetical protein